MTRVLGAVLAGGQSRRFGSDKAMAIWRGRTLLDWAMANLSPHVEEVVICGRAPGLADRPPGCLGPLAGLNAALHHGLDHAYDHVLTVPCDTPSLDVDHLRELREMETAAFVSEIPVIGLWPTREAPALDRHLIGDDRSMKGWVRRISARPVSWPTGLPNINRQEDLAALAL